MTNYFSYHFIVCTTEIIQFSLAIHTPGSASAVKGIIKTTRSLSLQTGPVTDPTLTQHVRALSVLCSLAVRH